MSHYILWQLGMEYRRFLKGGNRFGRLRTVYGKHSFAGAAGQAAKRALEVRASGLLPKTATAISILQLVLQ